MKTELTCAIARDLMPSYADGLTSGDSNRALEAHLAVCPDCAARLSAMRGEAAPAGAETAPQIDYLKKVRRRGRLTVWLAAICVALAAACGFMKKTACSRLPCARRPRGFSAGMNSPFPARRTMKSARCAWTTVSSGKTA